MPYRKCREVLNRNRGRTNIDVSMNSGHNPAVIIEFRRIVQE